MLNTNNTVNCEINVKQKYSWSTVFAWLYLKTIGRILPKKWNKWAENILSNKVTFQDTTMQTECVETTDKNIGADLKPEVAEKGSQSEVISKDGEVQTEENSEFTDESCFDTIVNDEFIDEEYDSMEEVSIEEDEELNEQLEDISQELELERSQNVLLEEENRELKFTITRLEKNHKELAEDAGKREEELVGVKEKDRKINSLTWSNEVLEQDKKEMEAKNNEQQRTISNQEKRIREQDALIKLLIDKNKDISETVEKDNEDLQAQVTKLKENLSVKEKESTEQLEKISSLQQKETELKQERKENVELKDRINALNSEKEEQLKAMKEECETHKENQRELERKLESLESQLSTAEVEKKSSENEVARLQEQLRILEGNKAEEIERLKAELERKLESSQGDNKKLQEQVEHLNVELEKVRSVAMSSVKAHTDTLGENYELKMQQVENSTAEDEQQNGKLTEKDTQEQTKAQGSSIISLKSSSTKKSPNYSMKSTQSNVSKVFSKLLGDKNLNNFLSRKNEELKKGFPEFKEKHFCHNVLNETIKSLSNQDDGKFESSKLLELLESNLKQSAREIIEAKVKEVVNKHCIEKNIGKELRDDTLKAKLLTSVKQCMKKLNFNEKDAVATRDSILHSFNSKNNNNNDSGKLLKEIVVKELVEARMRFFSDKIQELQLASSIRDKFLSPDQKMCNQTQGGVNKYQLTEKAKKEYTPNSSMSHTNTISVHSLNAQRVA